MDWYHKTERMYRTISYGNERNPLLLSLEEGMGTVLEITTVRYDLLVGLNSSRMSQKMFKHKVLKYCVLFKSVTASVKNGKRS